MMSTAPAISATASPGSRPALQREDAARARCCCDWSNPTSTLIAAYGLPVPRSASSFSASAAHEIQNALARLGPPTHDHNLTGRVFARAIIDGNATKFAAVMTLAKHGVINLNDPLCPDARASMLLELVNRPGASRAGVEFPASEFITVGDRITAMVAHGADPDHPHFSGALPLEYAWRNSTVEGMEVARALLAAGADPRKQNREGLTMLHRAAGFDNLELIRNWHAAGLPADTLTRQHQVTPLMIAVDSDSREAVDALLANGASTIATAADGQSPYSLALAHLMKTGDDRFVTLLQQHAFAAGVPEEVLAIVAGMAR